MEEDFYLLMVISGTRLHKSYNKSWDFLQFPDRAAPSNDQYKLIMQYEQVCYYKPCSAYGCCCNSHRTSYIIR